MNKHEKPQRLLYHFFLILSALAGAGACASVKAPPPWRIHSVEFTGNTFLKRYQLLNLMELKPLLFRRNPRFSSGKLSADIESIRRYYENNGFLEVSVKATSVVRDSLKKRVNVQLAIQEGVRTSIAEVTYGGWYPDSVLLHSLRCRAGGPLVMSEVMRDENTLKNKRREEGYLSSTIITRQSIDTVSHEVNLEFYVQSGTKVVVDSVILSGFSKLRPQVIKRELAFQKGDILTSKSIKKSERNLYRTGLINSVVITPDYKNPPPNVADSTLFPVSVQCREANFFRLKLGAGYGSEEKFRGSVETSYSNLFRLGHQISLKGNLSQRLQQVQTIYSTPWFLSIPLRFDGKLYYNRFSDTTTYKGEFSGINLSLEKPLFDHWTVHFFTTFEYVLWIKSEGLPENFPIKNTQSFGYDVVYDTRDNIMDPESGVFATTKVDIAGLAAVNSNRFMKFSEDVRCYWKTGPIGLASGLKMGVVRPYGGASDVPLQDQFYAGGSKSVRGYMDNSLRTSDDSLHHAISGTTMITANCLEIRFPIYGYLKGALFADAGFLGDYVTRKTITSLSREIRWSAGPGLRLKTPIAILRVDLGFKINKKPWEDRTRWHFDIGNSF